MNPADANPLVDLLVRILDHPAVLGLAFLGLLVGIGGFLYGIATLVEEDDRG